MSLRNAEGLTPVSVLGREWLEWLNAYLVGPERLSESLRIAKAGLVEDLGVLPDAIEATVGDVQACRVVVYFMGVDRAQWDLIWSLIPPDALRDFRKGVVGPVVRNAFAVSDVSLLPERYKEVKTSCTCADWMKPCKHALAVLRVLGAEIETDPMLLMKLRGGGPKEAATVEPAAEEEGEALRADEGSYWGVRGQWGEFEERLLAGGAPARLLKRLGPVSVYGMRMEPDTMFKPVYEGVATEARAMLDGIRRKVKK